jgi:hypothetical protein
MHFTYIGTFVQISKKLFLGIQAYYKKFLKETIFFIVLRILKR